jgi:hypothetical protein
LAISIRGAVVSEHIDHAGEPMPGMGIGSGNDVGIHGMLLFGEGKIYLSHLPMFDPPHNFQALLQVTLSGEGTEPHSAYLKDRAATSAKLYTFVPEEFPMSGLVGDSSQPPPVTSFKGSIFRGHFERGGTQLLAGVTASVDEVVYLEELDGTAKPLDGQKLEYLCLGEPGELFLAHIITSRPSFDHIVSFHFLDQEFAGHSGTKPVKFSDREDSPERKLKKNEEVSGFFYQSIGPRGQHGFSTQLQIGEEIYLEIEELA